MHPENVGPVLFEAGAEFGGEVLVREIENLDISHRVTRAVIVISDLEEQQVPVVVEQAFFFELLEVLSSS